MYFLFIGIYKTRAQYALHIPANFQLAHLIILFLFNRFIYNIQAVRDIVIYNL